MLAVVLAVLAVLTAVPVGVLLHLERRIENNLERIDAFSGLPNRPPRAAGAARAAVNLLLIGTDRRSAAPPGSDPPADSPVAGAPRSEVLMLVHIDADRRGASVISLPRDSWVEVPEHGQAKINAAYSYGGAPLTIATVEQLTGVRVDHLAMVDWAGFLEVTDVIGDVEGAAPQTLSRQEALTAARPGTAMTDQDLDRMRRQQAVLRRLAEQALDAGVTTDPQALMDLLDRVTRHMTVDEDWSTLDMSRLALSLRELTPSDVNYLTVPVAGTGMVGDQRVVHLDPVRAAELWDDVRADRMEEWEGAQSADLMVDP